MVHNQDRGKYLRGGLIVLRTSVAYLH